MPTPRKYLPIAEWCELTGIPLWFAREQCRDGKYPHITTGYGSLRKKYLLPEDFVPAPEQAGRPRPEAAKPRRKVKQLTFRAKTTL